MTFKSFSGKYKILIIVAVCAIALSGYLYGIPLCEKIIQSYNLFSDREKIKIFITSFGMGAPLVFIIIQILQVLFAPVPGEASGFIGGYLFGTAKGFLYSSIGLTVGSWINFTIGRFLGKHYVRKLIPARQLEKFDTIVKHQGVIVLFILFVFPGFPKDYLCFFLGLSALPVKVFLMLASIGRMPGTFMLSLQGAFLFNQMYWFFALILGLCLVSVFFAYRYREHLYQWIEKFNNRR